MTDWCRVVLAAALALLGAIRPLAAAAQDAAERVLASGVHGRVLDAVTALPILAAEVTLSSAPEGLLPGGGGGSGGFVPVSRTTRSDAQGHYRFEGLVRGRYRVHVARIGYRPASFDVHLEGYVDPDVSMALELEPVQLQSLVVGVPARGLQTYESGPPGSRATADGAWDPLARDTRFSTDSRSLSSHDLATSATLGETDLLRALHRLPGVSAADDWSAEPWVRGANWDGTRISYDGLPLYGALHGGGLFSAVSPDLVGEVVLHRGVQPASIEGAAAGAVELGSRSAVDAPGLEATVQLSVLSARVSAQRSLGPGSGVTAAVRRSYIDAVTRGEPLAEDRIPFRFSDFGGRWDQEFGGGFRFELSGLRTEDRVYGDLPHGLRGTRAVWGNELVRGTLELRRWGLRLRLGEGMARFDARVDPVAWDAGRSDLAEAPQGLRTRSRLTSGLTTLSVAPMASGSEGPYWEAGIESRTLDVDYSGSAPLPFPGLMAGAEYQAANGSRLTTAWATGRRALSETVDLRLGLRTGVMRDGEVRLAPRLALSWRANARLRLSAAAGRHHQAGQALAGAGFSIGPELVPAHLWLTHGQGAPGVHADVLTTAAEVWLGSSWLGSATLFARRSDGHVTPDPEAGFVRVAPPPEAGPPSGAWIVARERASGLEVELRRMTGRVRGSVSYSLARSWRFDGERSWRAPGDRRHALDVALTASLSPTLRFGGTLAASSGAHFTRFYAFGCPEDAYCLTEDGRALDDASVVGFAEEAGGFRGPSYVSVDLHLEKTGALFGLPFGWFVQLRNVLDQDNRSAYLGSYLPCGPEERCFPVDRFEGGMPLAPLLGFWLRL